MAPALHAGSRPSRRCTIWAPKGPEGGAGGGGGGHNASQRSSSFGGVFAQRQGLRCLSREHPLQTTPPPPTEGCTIHSKQHRGCRNQDPGTRGYRRWKTADFSHSARTAHGAPRLSSSSAEASSFAHTPCYRWTPREGEWGTSGSTTTLHGGRTAREGGPSACPSAVCGGQTRPWVTPFCGARTLPPSPPCGPAMSPVPPGPPRGHLRFLVVLLTRTHSVITLVTRRGRCRLSLQFAQAPP